MQAFKCDFCGRLAEGKAGPATVVLSTLINVGWGGRIEYRGTLTVGRVGYYLEDEDTPAEVCGECLRKFARAIEEKNVT